MSICFSKSYFLAILTAISLNQAALADEVPKADNTKVNERDRKDSEVTAGDQPSEGRDLEITRDIRRAITSEKKLSTNAHNIKIVTVAGVVTLKGPVASESEKRTVESIAKRVAGANKVQSEIGIAR